MAGEPKTLGTLQVSPEWLLGPAPQLVPDLGCQHWDWGVLKSFMPCADGDIGKVQVSSAAAAWRRPKMVMLAQTVL